VIVPFVTVHAYVLPEWFGTLAVWAGERAPTVPGAVTTGAGGAPTTVKIAVAELFEETGSGVMPLATLAVPETTEPFAAEQGSAATIVTVEDAPEASEA
jgi:hypothetical protein